MFKFKTRKVRELEQQVESLERTVAAQTNRYSKLLFDYEASQRKLREELEEMTRNRDEAQEDCVLTLKELEKLKAVRDGASSNFRNERDAARDQLAATQKLLSELREESHLLHQKTKEAADLRRTWQTRAEALEGFLYKASLVLRDADEYLIGLPKESFATRQELISIIQDFIDCTEVEDGGCMCPSGSPPCSDCTSGNGARRSAVKRAETLLKSA